MYQNRADAGRKLAAKLMHYANRDDVLVLALPRGGVPVAVEVARALQAPLDVLVVRKLGLPERPELAIGAIASGGVQVINDEVVNALGVPDDVIESVAVGEREELHRRERLYRGDRPRPDVRNRIVIVVDDGLATGSTMRAAVKALRTQKPARIVVAVPVGAPDTCADLQSEADEAICAIMPTDFHAVGLWYVDFSPTTDAEVRELLESTAELGDSGIE